MIRTRLRSKPELIDTYNRESIVYNLKRFSNKGGRYIDVTEKRLLSTYARGRTLLEIGVATGRFVPFVHSMGWNYTGVDISPRMLHHSRHLDGQLVLADGEQPPFKDSSFDSVICLHTFHFLPHPLACLREWHRLLKPDGVLILIFEMDTWLRRLGLKLLKPVSNQFYFRVREVEEMAQLCDFETIASGAVLKLPIEAYRKLPMTWIQRCVDLAKPFPITFATLGFIVAKQREGAADLAATETQGL
jgi:ubiquinone/menaquinone biosynthesis C-methylase UbiE